MSLKFIMAVMAVCLAVQGTQAIKCYESGTGCKSSGACTDAKLATTDNTGADRCVATYYDCAASKDKSGSTNAAKAGCAIFGDTTGKYYVYGATTQASVDAAAKIYTDTTGYNVRTCTGDGCNDPSKFNPNNAITVAVSALLSAAALALVL